MKISVLIIAHNEELYIAECIESILNQSRKPDEIVIIVHNSTDKTLELAKNHKEVQVTEHTTEEKGPHFARIKGFEEVSHEIVACIDGDGVADKDWLLNITKPLMENDHVVATGGSIRFYDNPRGDRAAFWFFLQGLPFFRNIFHFYFWGANFACKRSAYLACGGIRPLIGLREKLQLNYPAEDCYLSLALEKVGQVCYVRNANVTVYPGSFFSGDNDRGRKQNDDRKKLFRYFNIRSLY